MHLYPIKLPLVMPPKDDLFEALRAAHFKLKDGDIVAITSKVVSIGEGACVPIEGTDKRKLILGEAQWYREAPNSPHKKLITISRSVITGAAGIDESNGNGFYVLYPKDPFKSAAKIRTWLKKEYNLKRLGIIITDSRSDLLRRGATNFALAWDGFDPLRDYRGEPDLFGRKIRFEMANLVDSLAAAAGLHMGEVDEQIPVVVIRNAPGIVFKNRSPKLPDQLIVSPEKDIFAPIWFGPKWKRGKRY